MHQCPECGAEYAVLPDICIKCGRHFEPGDAPADLFSAALEQEQKSHEQQTEQRDLYLKLRAEKKSQQQAKALETAAQQETPDAQDAQQTVRSAGAAAAAKKSEKKWRWIAVAGIILLFAFSVFALRDGFHSAEHRSQNYAFYLQDHTLLFLRDDTGEKIQLNTECMPSPGIPDSYLQKLTQLSEDGSRIYYPVNFAGNVCEIACRELSRPKEEQIIAKIRMFPNHAPTVTETGRLDETEAFQFTDMLPPYILDDDIFFYINENGALCRRDSSGSTVKLSDSVMRYWKVRKVSGIFYLAIYNAKEYDLSSQYIPEVSSISATPWSVMEHTEYSCSLYHTAAGENQMWYPFPELGISGWALPYADSDQYFYFLSATEEGATIFLQADLTQAGFCESIDYTLEDAELPHLLCAYPDGSFYYATTAAPAHASTKNTFLHFFHRKYDKKYDLYGLSEDSFYQMVDICRTTPFAVICFASLELPALFRGATSVTVNIPAAGRTRNKLLYFDTKFPVLILSEDNTAAEAIRAALDFAIFSSEQFDEKEESELQAFLDEAATWQYDDSSKAIWESPAGSEPKAYYAVLSENANVADFLKIPRKTEGGTYFAHLPKNGANLQILCWNKKESTLLLPDTDITQVDRIVRNYPFSLYSYNYQNHSVSLLSDNMMKWLNCDNVNPDAWRPADENGSVIARSNDNELLLCSAETREKLDTATLLLRTGTLPWENNAAKTGTPITDE